MIPFLIAPAYNRHDLLARMLRSVDVPVERGLIIDNGRTLRDSPDCDAVLKQAGRLNLSILTPPFTSIGYGGSINFSILQAPDVPWWCWASNDVEFFPGTLATMASRMSDPEPRLYSGTFAWGAMNRALIETVGLIDEHSFFPIYFDDNDYVYRCRLAGVDVIEVWGEGVSQGDGEHAASLTIRSDAETEKANNDSFPRNERAYHEKWGGEPLAEQYQSPWNSGMPVWVTRPSVDGRRVRMWRHEGTTDGR